MSIVRTLLVAVALAASCSSLAFDNFITRDGHELKDGDQAFRFAGIHAPELHRIEDDARGVCEADPRGWGQYFRWPTADEQENWIKALVRSGHKAMRVYVLSVATPWDEACGRETHILPPTEKGGMPVLNEAAMVHYDRMIALSEEHGLRLILPFIDHWKWWGGREQLAAFYDETADDFYDTESKTYAAYLNIIEQVINRTNTLTGREYRDEKAILAWETGNELKASTEPFVRKTAAHIKALDTNHLVVDGTYLKINKFALDDPNVDIISNHFYTTNDNNNPEQVRKDLEAIDAKKVYLVGEFGLRDAAGLDAIMQAAVHTEHKGAKAAGAFIWGFRGHRHNGGFYWHKEYTGHYSYHIPGFPEAADNEEIAVVNLVRKAQAQMNGKKAAQPLPAPQAPILRAIVDPRERINFMGAPLGRLYRIERAQSESGPWLIVADNVSDGLQEYRPLEQVIARDTTAMVPGRPYFYRVIAINESGESPPSNVQPVVLP
ncbi:beta-mannanase man5E [Gilvimarinus sp. SDUM040013]|uniref:mannan endo-1,4-beta-mannosidase n=1 Tax=Gilvimarinus gilvus TaxID=3058038 RepID=A0ABU4S071_9GAMM|nr:beta-mannanase man5E [Gilvimarinus sp. SDUM040013]MDO3387429.1 beta-mannanase man5E [Gilvimarinus sp. SDUM040013]MDX6849906.1 beta-mannanase man5E [Gilvimarinus sp. SDUM040013]